MTYDYEWQRLDGEYDDAKGLLEELHDYADTKRQQLEDANEEIETLKEKITELENRIDDLEYELSERD